MASTSTLLSSLAVAVKVVLVIVVVVELTVISAVIVVAEVAALEAPSKQARKLATVIRDRLDERLILRDEVELNSNFS